MDAHASIEIALDFSPMLVVYKDGQVERLQANVVVPPSVDPVTGVASKDVIIDPDTGVSARLYLPDATATAASKLPVVVFYHGGGFCVGSAFFSHYHRFLNSLVSEANVVAVSVEYRLAPEHPLPAAYEDARSALRWVASHADGRGPEPWLAAERADFSRVFLAGDSAGANIAQYVALSVGNEEEEEERGRVGGAGVEGLVLLHPYFWGTERLPCESRHRGGDGHWITEAAANRQWAFVTAGAAGDDDPRINPTAEGAARLRRLGCRRALVEVAEEDILRDRGRAYCEALTKSGWGGEVQLWETPGEDHCFFLRTPDCVKAAAIMRRLVSFLQG